MPRQPMDRLRRRIERLGYQVPLELLATVSGC
jgi:hypothetical protein